MRQLVRALADAAERDPVVGGASPRTSRRCCEYLPSTETRSATASRPASPQSQRAQPARTVAIASPVGRRLKVRMK